MKLPLAAAISVGLLVGAPTAMAQTPYSPSMPQPGPQIAPAVPDHQAGGPSPMCHESAGLMMPIHCLHNLLWHGGETYYGHPSQGPR